MVVVDKDNTGVDWRGDSRLTVGDREWVLEQRDKLVPLGLLGRMEVGWA